LGTGSGTGLGTGTGTNWVLAAGAQKANQPASRPVCCQSPCLKIASCDLFWLWLWRGTYDSQPSSLLPATRWPWRQAGGRVAGGRLAVTSTRHSQSRVGWPQPCLPREIVHLSHGIPCLPQRNTTPASRNTTPATQNTTPATYSQHQSTSVNIQSTYSQHTVNIQSTCY